MMTPQQGTVVVIDDDPGVRESVTLLLSSAGYEYRDYGSAECYLASGRPPKPCCLLLDLHLPGMSGLELQRELRSRAETLPTLFVSGNASEADTRDAMAGGALDFLTKPIAPETLLMQTQRCLECSARDRTR